MDELLRDRLRAFLDEDLGHGDVTSEAVVSPDARARGVVELRASGTVAGLPEARVLADLAGLAFETSWADGDRLEAGDEVACLIGNARALLGVERTLLNLLSHLGGIATATRAAVDAVEGTGARIAATRKTLAGLRDLQKRAVIAGGGDPHRRDLSAAILIKDNHLVFADGVAAAIAAARRGAGLTRVVEIEVETEAMAIDAAAAGADIVMLDNMSPAEVASTVDALGEHGLRDGTVIEVSGGVTGATAPAYAAAGADVISMGALTASSPALDMSLHVTPAPAG